MFSFDWWRDKDNREGADKIVGILKVVIPAALVLGGAAWGLWPQDDKPTPSPAPTVEATGGAVVNTGSGNAVSTGDNSSVNIGGTQTNQSSNND